MRDGVPVALRPKTWSVLRCLLERPGSLVTKQQLLDTVWPDAVVSEGVLNKSIAELRVAFGDDRSVPCFIETVARRGFRWIGNAEVRTSPAAGAAPARPAASTSETSAAAAASALLVGRATELGHLEDCLGCASAGTRQFVFVTGEAGAGKSALVDAFLARLGHGTETALAAHSQCIEAYGQHEPYRPLLESIERLARRTDVGSSIVDVLRRSAPSWLRQLPSLAEIAPSAADDGRSPGRMLRELAAALEEISQEHPLVLVIEDGHWADFATTDACNLLARRRDPARLMVIVTMRTLDAMVAEHPVLAAKTELVSRGLASEVAVEPFTPIFVQQYLEQRCGGLDLDAEFAPWIHHQTAGNPLFVRILVDDLIERGVLVCDRDGRWTLQGTPGELREFVPDSLRALVEAQVARLSAMELDLIDAASVQRSEFTAPSVAAIAGIATEDAETICEGLARKGHILRHVVREGGTGTASDRFAFVHSMVQRILHDRLSAARLRRLHLAAADQCEREHPGREDAVAVQLALHYAMAGDPTQALAQLQRAAASVQRIPAPREVILIREQILDLVEQNPDLPSHRRDLVVATMDLAEARQLAFAVVDGETTALCERVLELAVTDEDARERFFASMGMFSNRFYTGRCEEAREIGRRLLAVAERLKHPFMGASAHFAIAGTAYRLGDLDEAQSHFQSCLEYSVESQQTYGWDFHVMSLSHLALLAVHRGQPDEARRLVLEAEEHGSGTGGTDPAVVPLFAYTFALLRDDEQAMIRAQRSLAQADGLGAAAWIERARFVHGLLLSRHDRIEEGVKAMKDSLVRQSRNNVSIDRSAYLALLADEMLRRGLPGAIDVVNEGIAYMARSKERHFEAELKRLQAALS